VLPVIGSVLMAVLSLSVVAGPGPRRPRHGTRASRTAPSDAGRPPNLWAIRTPTR